MTEQQQLLAAIILQPDEDTSRLVYADYLQENGDEDRAQFIRLQCEYAKYESVVLSEKDALVLAGDWDVIQYLQQSSYAFREAIDPNNPNGRYGLPSSLYGIKITVVPDAPDSGLTSFAAFRDRYNSSEKRNLYSLLEALIPANGQNTRKWFEIPSWGDHLVNVISPTAFTVIHPDTGARYVPPAKYRYTIRRGFIESVVCTSDNWFRHANEVWWHNSTGRDCPLTAQPIRKVTLTDSPVLRYEIEHRDDQPNRQVILRANMLLGTHDRVSNSFVRYHGPESRKQRVVSHTQLRDSRFNPLLDALESMDRELSPKKLLGGWFKGVEFELQGYTRTPPVMRGFPAAVLLT